jgi:hypothetical protein
LEHQGLKVLKVPLVSLGSLGHREVLDPWVQLDHRDLLEVLAHKELLVLQEQLVVQVYLEQQVNKVYKVLQVIPVSEASRVQRVLLAILDFLGFLDQLVIQE